MWRRGHYVIPNVRWGDETTYTDCLYPEPVAFLGVPKKSIVSIGTYGCVFHADDKRHFRCGLESMLDYLEPQVVLVYGSMPSQVFSGLTAKADFVHYPDWTTRAKGRG